VRGRRVAGGRQRERPGREGRGWRDAWLESLESVGDVVVVKREGGVYMLLLELSMCLGEEPETRDPPPTSKPAKVWQLTMF